MIVFDNNGAFDKTTVLIDFDQNPLNSIPRHCTLIRLPFIECLDFKCLDINTHFDKRSFALLPHPPIESPEQYIET